MTYLTHLTFQTQLYAIYKHMQWVCLCIRI